MAELEQSRRELAGEYERVQKKAFTNWVNSHLIKVGQKIDDLYQDFRDGNKLLLLLELLCNVKLRREKGKMRVHKLQNVQTALNFLQKEKKIKLVNIQNESLVDGNPKLTLGLVWTLILHFQISGALTQEPEGERPPQEISAKVLKEQLLEWAQRATEGYEDVEVKNFHSSWRDGLAFCAILDRHRPDLLNYDNCDPSQPMENLEKAFKVAEEELGIIRIVDPEDICVDKPDEKAVMTYVSFLHHAFPTMPPSHRKKAPAVSLDDYQQLYEATKQWISDKTQVVKSRDFPKNVKDMKTRMAELHKLKLQDVPPKQKDMETLADLYGKLQAQSKKSSPALPSDLEYPALETDWTALLKEVEASEKAMQEELEKLEKLQSLADKILAECDCHGNTLDQLEERVCQFESSCTTLPPEEAAQVVEELMKEIESLEAPVRELTSGVEELRKGGYHDTETVQQRVNALSSRLQSLSPRLEGASSAVSEAQAVVAMETNLKELEVWLVSCGRFSNNQHILMQIEDHKSFQLDQLAAAEESMSRINRMSPPPGMEQKVSEVNQRWEQVVRQTKERIAGLEPIKETVHEFNMVKNPLEDWCTQQREYFEHLPPLEVTEEQLREQAREFEAVTADIAAHREPSEKVEEMAQRFLRETEPVQSLADRYARKLKSRDVVSKAAGEEEEEQEASLGEQASILQGQWEWLTNQASARSNQISELLARLSQFNQQYETLREFVKEGNDLLGREKPVGSSAARIHEQMETCQNFRTQITTKQPDVDTMLALGRAIVAEPNTNPQNDTVMQKLTGFIEDWSDLQLGWQNWYDELHANLEQSKNLSDQLSAFGHSIKGLEAPWTNLFPATVTMENLDTELQELQSKFTTEVVQPFEEQKATYDSLKASASLLSDPSAAQETFSKFEAIANTVESYKLELSEVVTDVCGWWGGCVGVKRWVGEVEGRLVDQRPLAGSVDIVEEQRNSVQGLSADIEAHRSEVEGVLRSLTSLSSHKKLLHPSPVTSYCDALRTAWEGLCQEIENRKELTTNGKQHLSMYAGQSVPFATWLSSAEEKLQQLGALPRSKEKLFSCVEEFQAFVSDVESHEPDLDEVEKVGSQFLGCAKPYQSQLLGYRRKLHPEESGQLPECFVDLESEDLLVMGAPQFEGSNYENGIKVVSGDSTSLRRRYDALLADVRQRRKLLEEAKRRRGEFDSTLGELLPELTALEERCEGVRGEGGSQPEKIQEQVEAMQALEVECLALDPKLQAVQSAYSTWAELGKDEGEGVGVEGEEDDALRKKEEAERQYEALLDRIQEQKGLLDSELSNAQAFHDAFGDFIAWLRDTELKIQRDDPLKLEVAELKTGLAYLQGIAGDIHAHEKAYEELCSKCQKLVGRGMQDTEELQQKLDNLQRRWNALQIVNDDIEAIEETLPKLEAFYTSHGGISASVDGLHDQLDKFSTSAISSEGVESKNKALQDLVGEVGVQRSEFEQLLSSCDLLETPFDQSQFESDVSQLQAKMDDCDKLASDKKTQLKTLDRKIRPMEDLFKEFRAWLGATEEKLGGLSPPAGESGRREQQLQEAKAIIEDVKEHHESLESLESAVSDVLTLIEEEEDQSTLSHQLKEVTQRYNHLLFDSSCYPVDRWLEDRSNQLVSMAPSGVLVVVLQEQVKEVQEFQKTVDSYKPELETVAALATQCRRGAPSETDQSGESSADSKVADMQHCYDNLKSLAVERQGVLSSFVPTVQQYESSQGAWATLLCGWEEKAAMLPPAGARIETIQTEIEEIKALQQAVKDHEPEFTSLKREAHTLCEGPPTEAEYLTRVSQGKETAPGEAAARPGQDQLEETISDFDKRLEALKKKLNIGLDDLTAQLEKATQFQDILAGLLSWVTEAEGELENLKIRDPQSAAIEKQQQKCQVLLQQLVSHTPEKDKLAPLLSTLTSHLPSENPDREGLQNQFDELTSRWSDLTDHLGQCQSNLDSTLALAKNYEGAADKLLPWVPDTLNRLENLGPPPAEPEAVEKLKSEIENLKSEYNTLAPVFGTCCENGQSLAEHCEDSESKGHLETKLGQLQSDWEKLGQRFGEVLQKLSDALVQTQEFQTVANGLGRWMDGMQEGMSHQGHIAARVKLIEVQIEGFKPTLQDISAYSSTMDQVKTMGSALIGESNPEEQQKIQARIEALTSQFAALDTAAQTRMTRLEDALQKATVYEDQSNQFDKWLHGVEAKLSSWEPFSIASQPLKRQLEAIKELTQEVESHKSALDQVTESEESLFTSDLSTIQLCEDHILHSESSVDKQVLPDWLERPGAPEAVKVGADLRGRYDKLKVASGVKSDEASQLFERVEAYESEYNKFNDWLGGQKAAIGSFTPLAVTVEELRAQLEQVEALQRDFKNQEDSLESVNTKGTALVDGCKDELSRDSGRIKLSDLNDAWGNALSVLSTREGKLKEGIALAEKYQGLHDSFDSWLGGCEAVLAQPLKTQGDPVDIMKQLKETKALSLEIAAHKPQLEETVAAGCELEGYTDAEKASLPDIGYTALEERYNSAKLSAEDHTSQLDGVLDQVRNLLDKLKTLQDTLEGWRSKLKDHEPPHVLPKDVEAQLQELASLEQSVSELQPSIAQAQTEGGVYSTEEETSSPADEEDIPSGATILHLLSSVAKGNSEVKEQLAYWRDLLSASLDTATTFDNNYNSLDTWIKEMEESLVRAEAVRGVPAEVEKQLEQLEALESNISAHQSSLSSLTTLGHSMMDNASLEDSVIVGDRLAQITAAFEALQRNAATRRRALEHGLAQAREFVAAWDGVMAAIAGKSEELQELATVGVDIDVVKSQLEEYKEFEASLSELKPRMMTVLTQGKQLKESCSAKDGPLISDQLDQLNTAWSKLYSDSLGRKHKLEEALLQLGQFHDALAELLTWLADSMSSLDGAPPPGVQPDSVEAQMNELETVESGISSHTPSVASLNAAGEKLIGSSSTENTAEIQEDLKGLNERWEALKALTAKRRSTLDAALEKAKHFHGNWKQQVDWLNDAEKRAYAEWKPCALPETCVAEITKHQAFTEEVQSHRAPIDALKSEADDLKSQGSSDEGRMVERWMSDVVGRWEDLNAALEERQVQLYQAKDQADKFDGSYQSLVAGLGGVEEAQEKQEPIHSEVEVVKQQLEAHKEHLKVLANLESQLDDLDGLGQQLSRDCVKADGEVIQQRIADLRARWDHLHSEAIARQSALEESLLSLGQFEEAYDELWAWLTDALKQLAEMEPITGDPDAVAAQLSKHKALQKQLGARLSSKNAVTKAGKLLMKHKTGDDRVVLKKKLQDLEREWEEVCQVSVERQDRLEQAYKQIGQFRSHVIPLRSWMTKVLPMLDESEPVHGDIDTTDALMTAHSSFQRELGSYQKNVDAANASGDHLVTKVLDDPSLTKQELQEMNAMWDTICQKSTQKQERLDAAYQAAREFEEAYSNMMLWVEDKCTELQTMSPPDEDASVLQQQIEEHKAFSHEVTAKQPEYDTLLAEGRNLLQLAHPKAVPVLQDKLQHLEQRWVDLRGRIGARSEALASTLLELHGLQDMLGSLREWVAVAEGKMSETETTPIGDDLETIERQLAEHEAFQEEMATQQPNMDALNKVAKKRKAAHPHANPEMTKKISSLYKRWQKLWLRSSERHRQLLEAQTRLKDIAFARSFNFGAWQKRFLAWVDQQKLRVVDLFRRFDENHDGVLTRDEFMKALRASGLAMTQIELEKIADTFDTNRDGMINLNEIMAVVKGTKRTRGMPERSLSDAEKIDHEIQHQVSKCTCAKRFKVVRVAEGQYRFGESQKLRLVRILRSTVMVRVGGGWEPLEEFLSKHDPCRAASRTNAVLRSMLGERVEPGLATAGFTTKKQTAIAAQNAAMKREARKDPSATVTTRTLPSGRKETTITNRKPSPAREITHTRTEPIKHSLSRHLTPPRSTEQPVAKSPSPKASPKHAVGTGTQPGGRKGSGMASGGKGSRIPTPMKSTASKTRIPTKQSSDKLV